MTVTWTADAPISPLSDTGGTWGGEDVGRNLMYILGFDRDSPAVTAGRRHGAVIARLIDGLVLVREKHGLTQTDVATRMDTTQSSVSNF